ncbi:MAG: S8/S53 family peptidase [Verrucomicrobia bacterium]|nr:S8/S53 family peptidase [Verrucomicrobiota bacterium]
MPNIPTDYRALEGSERQMRAGARRIALADQNEVLTVSVRVRRRPDAPPLPDLVALSLAPLGERKYLSREDFAKEYGASEKDLDAIEEFARANGLDVVEVSIPRRTVVLKGTVAQMSKAFAVDLAMYETAEERYRGREGKIYVPANIADIVEGVFGLDNRKMAKPNISSKKKLTPGGSGHTTVPLTPPQVAKLYGFPAPPEGFNQTIGIFEFGGGYWPSDVQLFYQSVNLPEPLITPISVDGQPNAPDLLDPSTEETLLDINVAGSAAPGAKLAVYFAPWSQNGWVDVVTTAIHDTTNNPSVISISWGWAENQTAYGLDWTPNAITTVNATFQEAAAMGVTILVSSGDYGSYCQIDDRKAHVQYPASDPYVTCVGGTRISNVSGSNFTETTWSNDGVTGGGISDVFYPPHFPLPPWQNWVTIPGSVNDGHIARGIPDIAGYADPGYELFVDGTKLGPVPGTSLAAPFYAALVALINARIGTQIGWLNPQLYLLAREAATYAEVFRDIKDGLSNAAAGSPGYTAGPGWDACTGLGTVNGTSLLGTMTATLESTICKQTAQSIRNAINNHGPRLTVAEWTQVKSQLEQCVREGYLTQATVNGLITEYENWIKTSGGPPRL